jgi:hypothetical protein
VRCETRIIGMRECVRAYDGYASIDMHAYLKRICNIYLADFWLANCYFGTS